MPSGSINARTLPVRMFRVLKFIYMGAAAWLPKSGQTRTIFVGGTPRSGTNMLMYALDRSWQTDVAHEIDPRLYERYALRGDDSIDRLRKQGKARFLVIKCLFEGDQMARFTERFAPAKAIWLTRHFDAMIKSHRRSFPTNREMIEEVIAGNPDAGWRGRGMSETTRQKLADAFSSDLNHESVIALFWWHRNQLVFDQQLPSRQNVLILDYDELTADPQAMGRMICERTGLAYRPWMFSGILHRPAKRDPIESIAPHIRAMCDETWERLKQGDDRPA